MYRNTSDFVWFSCILQPCWTHLLVIISFLRILWGFPIYKLTWTPCSLPLRKSFQFFHHWIRFISCFLDVLHQHEKFPSHSEFAEGLYHEKVLAFVKWLSSIETNHVFLLCAINVMYDIDGYSCWTRHAFLTWNAGRSLCAIVFVSDLILASVFTRDTDLVSVWWLWHEPNCCHREWVRKYSFFF